jgi:hypothetical protein
LLGLLLCCPDELKVVRLAADGDAVGLLHIPTQLVLVISSWTVRDSEMYLPLR